MTSDAGSRADALASLDSFALAVPPDPAARVRLLRDMLVKPDHAGSSRLKETWGNPPVEGLVATPSGYDPKQAYAAVFSFAGYSSDPHASLRAFALPREEWAEMRERGESVRPPLGFPWEDGIVLAPTIPNLEEFDEKTYVPARAIVLDALARANRELAVDPDRVYAAGYSLGSTVAYDMAARHPDRFAAIADVSGGCPRHPTPGENLRTLKIYIQHGDADETVPLPLARDIASWLGKLGVEHVLEVVPGGKHSFPETPADGARVAEWLKRQKRDPWPRQLELTFAPSEASYRIFWIEVPPSPRVRRVRASVEDNRIALEPSPGIAKLVLHLGEPLVDLGREVQVTVAGKERFRGTLGRSFRALVEDLETDGWDCPRAAPCRLEVPLE